MGDQDFSPVKNPKYFALLSTQTDHFANAWAQTLLLSLFPLSTELT